MIEESPFTGFYVITHEAHQDDRGIFFESFKKDEIKEATGLDFNVAQINTSISKKGTIRGIHFKESPPGQAKYVTVNSGSIFDVAVDLRRHSPHFGQHFALPLTSYGNRSYLMKQGFGHAFIALEDDTRVTYLCDTPYEPELEHGLNPFSMEINWTDIAESYEIEKFIVSERDREAPDFDPETFAHFHDLYWYD